MKSAFLWSFISNYFGVLVQIVSVMALARLLTPSEIGSYAIAGAIFAIAQMFRDMGLSSYLIKEENLTAEKKKGALFVSWSICILLSFILYFASDSIGDFYSNPEIGFILNIFCINLLLIPIGILEQSQLRRDLDFKKLAYISGASQIIHLLVALFFAIENYGAISLAYASLAATITTILLVKVLSPNRFFYFPRMQSARRVLPFVFRVGGANILDSSNAQGQPIIVGKLLSEEAVAILDKGTAAIMMLDQFLFNAIQRVLVPLFSKLKREQKDIPDTYLDIVSIVTCIAWPFLAYLAFNAEIVIMLLFGSQWVEAIVLVPYLCCAFAIGTISKYFNELLISTSLERQLFKTSIMITSTRLITLILVAPYGLKSIVISLIFVEAFKLVITSFYLNKYLKIHLVSIMLAFRGSLVVLCIGLTPIIPLLVYDIKITSITLLILHSALVFIFWVAALIVIKHPLVRIIGDFVPKYKR